jgi:hypothetical protein
VFLHKREVIEMKSKKKCLARNNEVDIHWVTDSGWIHTHGLSDLGLPELEIRDVPGYLGEAAVSLIRRIHGYMIDNKRQIKAGETFVASPRTCFRLVASFPIEGHEDHYIAERLRVVDREATCQS